MCFGSTPDYTGAGQIQAAGANQAAGYEQSMLQQAMGQVAPWRKEGKTAATQLGGLFGLPGYKAVDPTKTLEATPGYQWGLTQGVQALDRSAAAKGSLQSGAQANATNQFGQQYGLSTAWQPYVSQLNQMSNQGLQAGQMGGNWSMQAGQSVGQDYMAAANAQAQAQIQQQNAQNQSMGGWMQGLGMLGGLALAPFTGGTSLLGSAASGLSGLFGGGTGSAGSGGGGGSLIGTSNAYTPGAMGYGSGGYGLM